MKNQKSTTPESFDLEANQDEIALFGLREEVEKNIPPVSEIAHLAALLTHGNPVVFQNPTGAARHAAELWAACSRQRAAWIDDLARRKLMRDKEEAKQNALGMPKTFPVPFADFLIHALPKKRLEDREKLYRDMLRASIRHSKCYPGTGGSVIPIKQIPLTTDAEVADCMARHRKTGFDEFQYVHCLLGFRNYAAAIEKEKLQIRGQTAGKASAAKKAKDKAEREDGKPVAKEKLKKKL